VIFVDTSYLFAGIEPDDAHHDLALRLSEGLGNARLITTNHVRGEAWTLIRRRDSHRVAVQCLDGLARARRIEVAHVDSELEDQALDWLRIHDERGYSFVDATSFAFMRRHGISEALAFDGDFAAAGFVELRP